MRRSEWVVGSLLVSCCLISTAPLDAAPVRDSAVIPAVYPERVATESDWRDVARTFREIRFRGGHPTPKRMLAYSGLLAGAIYFHNIKDDLAADMQEDRSPLGNSVSSTVRPLGEAIIPLAVLGTYAIGRISGSESTRRAGLILSEAAAFTVLATEIGQYIFAEQRPQGGGKLSFFSSGGHGVSGHTSIVAAMSVPMDRLFFQVRPDDGHWRRAGKYLGKAAVYSLPVMTGWSRLNDNKHYAWNVVLGLGTGYMVGDFVASAHGMDGRSDDDRHWSVAPLQGDRGGQGLAVRWSLP